VDFRAVTLLLASLMLGACGGPEPADEDTVAPEPTAATAGVRYDQSAAGSERAGPDDKLVNPFAGDQNAEQQGEALFAAMNCDGCHGGGGVGFVGPSLVDGRWRYGGDDTEVFRSIMQGRPNGMPSYSGLLSDATVWQLVSYVRAQPIPNYVPTLSWSDD